MKKKIFVFVMIGMLFMVFGLILDGAPQHRKMMNHAGFGIRMAEQNMLPPQKLLKFKDEIGLTAAQVGKLEKMCEVSQESAIRAKADIQVLELKLRNYLKSDKVDRGQMEKMVREIAKMKTDMKINHFNRMLDVKALLTPEQLEKIDALKKEWRKNRNYKGKGHRGNKGRGQGHGMGQGMGRGMGQGMGQGQGACINN